MEARAGDEERGETERRSSRAARRHRRPSAKTSFACGEHAGCSCTYQITTSSSDRHILPATSSCPGLARTWACVHAREHARTNKPSGAGGCRSCGSPLPPGLFGAAVSSHPHLPTRLPSIKPPSLCNTLTPPSPAPPLASWFPPRLPQKVLPCGRCFFRFFVFCFFAFLTWGTPDASH